MKRKLTSILLTTCMLLMSVANIRAGGPFETVDITAGAPSPIPGHILARVIGIRWDARSIPVQYRMNNTLNPIPNPPPQVVPPAGGVVPPPPLEKDKL